MLDSYTVPATVASCLEIAGWFLAQQQTGAVWLPDFVVIQAVHCQCVGRWTSC